MQDDRESPLSTDIRRGAGHYEVLGETYAKFEFFENGWNPYTRFLDVDKVDLILRRRHQNRPTYREVQVKYGKLYEVGPKWERELFDYTSWRFFDEDEFAPYLDHSDFFIALVLAADIGYQRDIFIFPVRDFVRLVKLAIPSGGKRKVYISRCRKDPRYFYKASDVEGHIYVKKQRSGLPKKDEVYLDTFGFAYNKKMTRAVAVYIRYLKNLTPQHQRQWKAKILRRGSFKLHPDYFNMSVIGDWATHFPILDALLMELECINGLCVAIGRKPLFRRNFKDEKPPGFTFLLRPTTAEFNSFVLLLDKVMSDNIDKDFFRGQIPLEREITRSDGKIIVEQKGTIQLLEEWFNTNLKNVNDPNVIPETLKAFREVRKLRQNPAHVEQPNEFDQKYLKRQRDLIIRAYLAMQAIRQLFASHPRGKMFQVPDVLKDGLIRTF